METHSQCLFLLLYTSTGEHFLFKDAYLKVQLCQRIDMSKMAQKLPKQSMPDVYSVILEYEETQEAESIRDIASLRINLSLKTVQLSPPMFNKFCE